MISRRDILKTILTFVPVSLLGKTYEMNSSKMTQKRRSLLRFAVASDGHYGQDDTAYEMYFSNILKWLRQEKENEGLDLVVLNGDIIHDNPEFLPVVKKMFDTLPVPCYPVQGNHDMVSSSFWKETWGVDVNHSFEINNSAFVLMTTSNEKGDYLCGDLAWLTNEIEKYNREQHVFLFLHISQNGWTRHGIDCPELIDYISNSERITAVFHGHDHHEDDVKYDGKVPYFWCGHFGGSWGQEYKGYRIVEVTDQGIVTYMKNPLGRTKMPEQEI